jgi:putative acetyltransferase
MKRLYVRPGARGTGLGRALIAAVLAEATRLGYREIKLDTLPQLEGAIAVYRDLGFQRIAPYAHHPYEGTICFGRIV